MLLLDANICLCPPDKFPALSFFLSFNISKIIIIFLILILFFCITIVQEPISKFSSIVKKEIHFQLVEHSQLPSQQFYV